MGCGNWKLSSTLVVKSRGLAFPGIDVETQGDFGVEKYPHPNPINRINVKNIYIQYDSDFYKLWRHLIRFHIINMRIDKSVRGAPMYIPPPYCIQI